MICARFSVLNLFTWPSSQEGETLTINFTRENAVEIEWITFCRRITDVELEDSKYPAFIGPFQEGGWIPRTGTNVGVHAALAVVATPDETNEVLSHTVRIVITAPDGTTVLDETAVQSSHGTEDRIVTEAPNLGFVQVDIGWSAEQEGTYVLGFSLNDGEMKKMPYAVKVRR